MRLMSLLSLEATTTTTTSESESGIFANSFSFFLSPNSPRGTKISIPGVPCGWRESDAQAWRRRIGARRSGRERGEKKKTLPSPLPPSSTKSASTLSSACFVCFSRTRRAGKLAERRGSFAPVDAEGRARTRSRRKNGARQERGSELWRKKPVFSLSTRLDP